MSVSMRIVLKLMGSDSSKEIYYCKICTCGFIRRDLLERHQQWHEKHKDNMTYEDEVNQNTRKESAIEGKMYVTLLNASSSADNAT